MSAAFHIPPTFFAADRYRAKAAEIEGKLIAAGIAPSLVPAQTLTTLAAVARDELRAETVDYRMCDDHRQGAGYRSRIAELGELVAILTEASNAQLAQLERAA